MDNDPTEQANPPPGQHLWLVGILVGDAVVVLLYAAGALLLNELNALGMLGLPSFLLVPVLGGLVASYIWRTLRPTIGVTCLNTVWMTLLALLGGALVFHEGVICLAIVSPLFFISVLAGSLFGRILFKTYPTRLRLSLLPLLLLGVLSEPLTRDARESVITDEILIHAPAAKVWSQLTSFPEIPSPPRFWLFRLGLPYPLATTSEGDFVNAERQCIFSHGAIFKERVRESRDFLTCLMRHCSPAPAYFAARAWRQWILSRPKHCASRVFAWEFTGSAVPSSSRNRGANSGTFTDTVCWTFLSDGKQPAHCSPMAEYARIMSFLAPIGSASKSNPRPTCHSPWNC